MEEDGPRLGVNLAAALPDGLCAWRLLWTIQNQGDAEVDLLEVWLPHGQFRAERQELGSPQHLLPGASTALETLVHAPAPPSGIVENAFLITRVLWHGNEWRVFVRLRVTFREDAQPQPVVELVTAHRAGLLG